jgi:hypothetical protein
MPPDSYERPVQGAASLFIDVQQLARSDIRAELCVIGTGPAALTVARQVSAGRDVLLLEAGPDAEDARRPPGRAPRR